MTHWFEDLTKTVADERLPRRQAIRRIAGSMTGIALASWLPGHVLAKTHPDGTKECPYGGCGCASCQNCSHNPNKNCYCFITLDIQPKAVCICNTYCSQLPTCMNSKQCGAGYVCITNNGCTGCGTSYGVCIAKCKGKNKNCQLGSGHGLTVTGKLL